MQIEAFEFEHQGTTVEGHSGALCDRENQLRYKLMAFGSMDGRLLVKKGKWQPILKIYGILFWIFSVVTSLACTVMGFISANGFNANFAFKVVFMIVYWRGIIVNGLWLLVYNRKYADLCKTVNRFCEELKAEGIPIPSHRNKTQNGFLIFSYLFTCFNATWVTIDLFVFMENPFFGKHFPRELLPGVSYPIFVTIATYILTVLTAAFVSSSCLCATHTLSIYHLYHNLNKHTRDILLLSNTKEDRAKDLFNLRTLINKMRQIVDLSNECFKMNHAADFAATVLFQLLFIFMLADFIAFPGASFYITFATVVWFSGCLGIQIYMTVCADCVYSEVSYYLL